MKFRYGGHTRYNFSGHNFRYQRATKYDKREFAALFLYVGNLKTDNFDLIDKKW